MKHPKHRIGDVLLWHPDARDEVYNYVRNAVATHFPAWLKTLMAEIQQVGSMTWGGSTLRSDVDFNIALKKTVSWLNYAKARRWYYSPLRGPFANAMMQYQIQWGLKIDVGLMDVEADAYNTYVSLSTMQLFHRGDDRLDDYVPNNVGTYPSVIDPSPIDLLTFSGTPPPKKDQHLIWDGYKLRWARKPAAQVWKLNARWSQDEWASEIPTWANYYGANFQTYHQEGNVLVQD